MNIRSVCGISLPCKHIFSLTYWHLIFNYYIQFAKCARKNININPRFDHLAYKTALCTLSRMHHYDGSSASSMVLQKAYDQRNGSRPEVNYACCDNIVCSLFIYDKYHGEMYIWHNSDGYCQFLHFYDKVRKLFFNANVTRMEKATDETWCDPNQNESQLSWFMFSAIHLACSFYTT